MIFKIGYIFGKVKAYKDRANFLVHPVGLTCISTRYTIQYICIALNVLCEVNWYFGCFVLVH